MEIELLCPVLAPPVECRSIDGIGGGRGVFATADIPAGAIVLFEEPALQVPQNDARSGETWHVAVARRLLKASRDPQGAELAASHRLLSVWHPQSLAELPSELLQQAKASLLGSWAAQLAAETQ
ncbi:unnamed protein product, partial [Polarella glacialis]